jgi:hypothetical protein
MATAFSVPYVASSIVAVLRKGIAGIQIGKEVMSAKDNR